MAETSGPFDSADLTEANWELMLDQLVDGHLSGLAASASGSTIRGVDFTAGSALVRGHWYRNSATLTKASSANGAGSARIDRAVFRLDRTANTVTMEILTGTPGSATPPALTDTATVTERPFKRWTVAPGATAVTGITDEAQALARGTRKCTSTNRPINPTQGDPAYEVDTGRWVGWTGTQWVILYEDTGWITLTRNGAQATHWTDDVISRIRRINRVVHLRISIKRYTTADLSTSTSGGSVPFILPADFRPSTDEVGFGYHSRSPVGIRVETDGQVRITPLVDNITAGRTVQAGITYMVD